MQKMLKVLFYIGFMMFSMHAYSDKTYQAYAFETREENARFHALLSQLRCVVCQNQSLADSDAMLAQSMQNKVYEMLQAGDSDETILSYLTLRYGDFILLEPPMTTKTYLLWLGPFVLLLCCIIGAGSVVSRIHTRYKVEKS